MTSSPSSSEASPTAADGHAPLAPRRSVLVHFVTAVLSFVIVTIPATLGGLFFLDPILRKRKDAEAGGKPGEVSRKDEKGFIRLNLTRDAVPADGTPVASICPHLGCSVDFRPAEQDFFCPCHTSAFALDGKKTNEIPPRDMDSLEVSMRTNGADDPAGQEIWVRYQKFRGATAEKIAV